MADKISTPAKATSPVVTEDDELIQILGNSLYPGARSESIRMVLAWCRATGRDPMKKPIHIVPMEVKDAKTNQKAYRDVLMPGIGTYRTDAANSGAYGGIDEPEFGPEITEIVDGTKVTFPQWCRVTVYRMVGGERRAFTANERWLENYAAGFQGKGVNAMWRKRPYGQLAKCAESQALRKAFPDETGDTKTSEEMEGKSFEGPTIDAGPERKELRETRREQHRPIKSEVYVAPDTGGDEAERISAFMVELNQKLYTTRNGADAFKLYIQAVQAAPTLDDLASLEGHEFRKFIQGSVPSFQDKTREAFEKAAFRLATPERQWDAPTNGLSGGGRNGTHAQGDTVRDEVEKVANKIGAPSENEDRDEDDGWSGPGENA